MQPHHERGHSTWSASATERNWTCSGALAMTTLAGPEKESEHSAKGSAAHELAEKCLRSKADAIDFLGTIVKTKHHEIEIDEELANSAQMYVDYVRQTLSDSETGAVCPGDCALLAIEQNVSLSKLNPPFDAGGTGDAVILSPSLGLVEVVDLKNGMGVVNVNENKQLRTYGLGSLLAMRDEDAARFDMVKVTIVQPRAPHKDGRIRSETFHVADLIDWTHELMKAMHRSKVALDEFEQIGGNRVKFDEWAEKWLTPGACKFCPAEGFCPKLRQKALSVAPETAQKWFEDPSAVTLPDLDLAKAKGNAPELQSPEALGHVLDGLEMLEDWIKALRSHAHAEAERGNPPTGWQLSDKIGNRKWAADEAKVVSDLKAKLKLTDEQIYQRKLSSPSQIEKIIGAKRKDEIKNMWSNPVTGTNLVSVAKSTRPAAKSKIEQHFEPVEKE